MKSVPQILLSLSLILTFLGCSRQVVELESRQSVSRGSLTINLAGQKYNGVFFITEKDQVRDYSAILVYPSNIRTAQNIELGASEGRKVKVGSTDAWEYYDYGDIVFLDPEKGFQLLGNGFNLDSEKVDDFKYRLKDLLLTDSKSS